MRTEDERPGPLHGVKVLDLSRMYPGAMCTLLLADLGADVVKVEGPGAGDGLRFGGAFPAAHVALNRGKRSVGLDLRHDGAAPVLSRLVGWADVVVESHRPGQLDERGLGYEAMGAAHPKVVWCSITGFGDFGPNAAAAGHDITFLGASGLLSRLSDVEPPTPPRTTIAIPLAASMAATGILAAVLEARTTGRGARLDANMTDAAMWVLGEDVARAANAPAPGWGAFAARNVYRCADGRYVTVAATEPRPWAALCDALEVPELAGHRLGVDDDAAAQARLAERFATRPASEWTARPGLAGGVGPVNEPADVLDDPQVTGRGSIVAVESGERVLANPLRFGAASGADASHALTGAPALGQHTDEVLVALGVPAAEVEALRGAGVVV